MFSYSISFYCENWYYGNALVKISTIVVLFKRIDLKLEGLHKGTYMKMLQPSSALQKNNCSIVVFKAADLQMLQKMDKNINGKYWSSYA